MIGALIILAAMVVIGIILYVTDRLYYRKKHPEVVGTASPETDTTTKKEPQPQPAEEEVKADTKPTSVPTANPMDEPEVCCGAHTVCEKTNLSPSRVRLYITMTRNLTVIAEGLPMSTHRRR